MEDKEENKIEKEISKLKKGLELLKEPTREMLEIADEKAGTRISIISQTKSHEEILNSAFLIKQNFFDEKNHKRKSYLG